MVARRLRNLRDRVWAQRPVIAIIAIFEYSALVFNVGVAMTVTAWCWSGYLFCLSYVRYSKAKILEGSTVKLADATMRLEYEKMRGRAIDAEQRTVVLEYALGMKQRLDDALAEHPTPPPLSPEAIAASLELAEDRLGRIVERVNDPSLANELLSISSVLMELRGILLHDGRIAAWRLEGAKKYADHFVEASDQIMANIREMNQIKAEATTVEITPP